MYFSLTGEMLFFFIFIITGYLTSFFSKNMIVIMVVSMTVTHCIRYGKGAGNEGMSNKNEKEPFDPEQDRTKLETAPANVGVSAPMSAVTNDLIKSSNQAASASIPTATNAIDKLKKSTAQIQEIKDKLKTSRVKDMATPIGSFSNSPAPASNSLNRPSDLSDLMNTEINSPLAINNTKPVVSGFENLDAQTKKLLNTQQELMLNMDNLSPLLAQAEKFMEKFQGLAK